MLLNCGLEKTLETTLDYKEIKPVNPKGNQSRIFIGRTDAETEVPILWPPDAKSWLIRKDPDAGKDWRHGEKGITEDKMVGGSFNSMDVSLSKLQEMVKDREAWLLQSMGSQSRTQLSDWTTATGEALHQCRDHCCEPDRPTSPWWLGACITVEVDKEIYPQSNQ